MNDPNVNPSNRRNFARRLAKARIKATCRKGTLDLGPNLAKAVLDLSESGLRLVVTAPLLVGEQVSIGLEGTLHMRPIQRVGKVVWAAQLADGNHVLGIMLEKYLAYNDVRVLT